jgi:hypothetical protein
MRVARASDPSGGRKESVAQQRLRRKTSPVGALAADQLSLDDRERQPTGSQRRSAMLPGAPPPRTITPYQAEAWVGVVVDASAGELAGAAADVDSEAGLRRRFGPAHRTTLYSSAHEWPSSVTVQCSSGMPPAVREEQLVQRDQLVAAPMDVRAAGGLAQRVGLEDRDGGLHVAGGKRALVVAEEVGRVEVRVWLQQRWAVGVSACQRPIAPVEAELDDARAFSSRSAATATGSSTRPWSPSSASTVSSIPRRGVMIRSTGLPTALRAVSQALVSATNRSKARRPFTRPRIG